MSITWLKPARLGGLAGAIVALGHLSGAQADTHVLPPDDIDLIGTTRTVTTRYEDTLLDVARRYGLGYEELVSANPDVDPWLPGEGTEVFLPTRYILPDAPRKGIVINLPELRLYYYPKPKRGATPRIVTHPISIGRMDWGTPLGLTRIESKVRKPAWYPPESVRAEHAADGRPLPKIVPPGPENPLGDYAMRLAIPGYLIHGTNRPSGIGMRVTHGCIRMYPEDIEAIFGEISVRTPVRIVNQPVKVGWVADSLFLEVHRPLEEDDEAADKQLTSVTETLVRATRERTLPIDWDTTRQVFEEAKGVPIEMSVQPGTQRVARKLPIKGGRR